MRTAIFVGLPRDSIRRIDNFLRTDSEKIVVPWAVKFIPAKRSTPEVHRSEVVRALDTAAASINPHIIAVSKQDKILKQPVAKAIKPYFRFRWLDNSLLSFLTNIAAFIERINAVLEEESDWDARVKPTDILSPLVLPQECFDANHHDAHMWTLAEQYGDASAIIGAQRAIDAFRERYWQSVGAGGRRWTDSADRIFDHTGPRHGRAPFPRNWKLSLQLDMGFHYDVTTSHGRPFSLNDSNGVSHKIEQGRHINVDPHGFVRAN